MKVTIVINGEEMFTGEAKSFLAMMPPGGNEIQIAFDGVKPTVARNRSARMARRGHAPKDENAESKSFDNR